MAQYGWKREGYWNDDGYWGIAIHPRSRWIVVDIATGVAVLDSSFNCAYGGAVYGVVLEDSREYMLTPKQLRCCQRQYWRYRLIGQRAGD